MRLLLRLAASGNLRGFVREAQKAHGRPHAFMTHAEDCSPSDPCNSSGMCRWADKGLACCRICGLAEGALTVHCPGVDASRLADDVYGRNLDFVGGEWIRVGPRGGCSV